MIYLVIFIFICISIYFFILRKDIFHPAVCLNLVFAVVLIGYECTSYMYIYTPTDSMLLFVLVNVLIFTLSALFGEGVLELNIKKTTQVSISLTGTVRNIKVMGWIVIISSGLYLFIRLSNYQHGNGLLQYMISLRENDVVDTSRSYASYLQPVMLTTFSIFIWARKIALNKMNAIFVFMVYLFFSCAIVLNTGKQIVFTIILSYAFLLGINKFKHYIYLFMAFSVLFITYMLFLRGLSGGLEYYFSMYLVSPLIAFQEFYFSKVSITANSHVFWFFERLWGGMTEGTAMSLHKDVAWVGLPTNVYTAFSDYIYITPMFCYLMMVFHGAISGVLWRLSHYYIGVKVFYSFFIYSIIFIFYHESFMTNISSWIQIALSIMIFSQLIKVDNRK